MHNLSQEFVTDLKNPITVLISEYNEPQLSGVIRHQIRASIQHTYKDLTFLEVNALRDELYIELRKEEQQTLF